MIFEIYVSSFRNNPAYLKGGTSGLVIGFMSASFPIEEYLSHTKEVPFVHPVFKRKKVTSRRITQPQPFIPAPWESLPAVFYGGIVMAGLSQVLIER